MFIDIIPLQKNTARLTRVYGDAPCAALPASVPGPEGGVLAITELGDYCFSEKPRSLPGADALCRYEVSPDGTCAFYNCRRLRRLSVGAGDLTVGSDVFLNCFALADLLVRAAPEEKTGLFALVNNITEAVRALFWLPGEARPRAGLWYPAYWEDVEESPAHILLHTFSGQGYHYRQCFLDGKILSAEYDAIFPDGHAAEDQGVAAMLCFDRLRWPWNLTEKAKAPYREFLAAHTDLVLQRLLKAQDTDSIKDLLALDVLDAAAFAEGAALAAKADNAAAAALLADAEHKKRGSAPKKRRYDFDF